MSPQVRAAIVAMHEAVACTNLAYERMRKGPQSWTPKSGKPTFGAYISATKAEQIAGRAL